MSRLGWNEVRDRGVGDGPEWRIDGLVLKPETNAVTLPLPVCAIWSNASLAHRLTVWQETP
jgi:hypothetical protein